MLDYKMFLARAQAVVAKTVAAYTALLTDYFIRVDATAQAVTITLPDAVLCVGFIYRVKKFDSTANTVTVKGAGAQTIDGANTFVLGAQYATITVQSNGVSWDIL